jgi:hypothetical protein
MGRDAIVRVHHASQCNRHLQRIYNRINVQEDAWMQSLPRRKSPRLKEYDYRQAGAYFVTICTVKRLELFGTINDGVMALSPLGQIASEELLSLPAR